MRQRLDFIDLAKGFGMLMVIYLHISINYPSDINVYANSWWDRYVHTMFMPIFFILSGYFFSVKKPFKEWVLKKTKRLVLPFCMFYMLTYLINVVLVTFLGVKLKSGFSYGDIFIVFYKDVFPNSAIWFLLALFWSSIILYWILKLSNKLWIQMLMVLICLGIGVILDRTDTNIPLYIDTAFTATIFVYTGCLMKKSDVVSRLQTMNVGGRYALMSIIAAVSFVICWCWGEGASMVNNNVGHPITFYVTAVAGSLSVIALSYIMNNIWIISYIGRYSMLVLCTHMYLTNLFARIMMKFDIPFVVSSLAVLLCVCLCYYGIVPIVKRIKVLKDILL